MPASNGAMVFIGAGDRVFKRETAHVHATTVAGDPAKTRRRLMNLCAEPRVSFLPVGDFVAPDVSHQEHVRSMKGQAACPTKGRAGGEDGLSGVMGAGSVTTIGPLNGHCIW